MHPDPSSIDSRYMCHQDHHPRSARRQGCWSCTLEGFIKQFPFLLKGDGSGTENPHESDDGSHFDDGEDKLGVTVSADAKQVDYDDQDVEDGDPDGTRNVSLPVFYRHRRGHYLQWKDHQPLQCVIPAHRKAPGGIEKAG